MRSLLLFDGLGGAGDSLVPALRALLGRPENASFRHAVCRAVDAALEYLGPDAPASGLPLEKWLDGLDPPPLDSTAAGVCLHVHQLCGLQPTGRGDDGAVGALGHSLGLQAAIVAGLGAVRPDEFLRLAAASVRLVAISLVRAHQVGPPADDVPTGPMAAITGLTRDELARRVEGTGVVVGLVNAPTAHVLSGPADALAALRDDPAFDGNGVRWSFLPNTVPFHTPALAPVVERVRADLDAVGPWPAPDRLALPIYAGDAPRDLRAADDLVDEYLHQVFTRPIDWPAAVDHAVADSRTTRVLDHGPGAGARRFARECLGARVRFDPVRRPGPPDRRPRPAR
ncbi:ACP S-malonyltransferase [Saccharothrix variisporea]|uniref:[acyl-carrier-protein] S-malonyltransferase n=1 Tax=Saccharothrix variisporea TaxID=543527 RepID=A0A495XK65_9PSEU|nr:ACP S-malonyltransferase [Saccharothrix variisporea]RKT74840.1 hypothetical protein DFJ66_8214 [Saccharothrix variisporea]